MADDLSSFAKDVLLLKTFKKSTIAWRIVVLVLAMICGVYICAICLKQAGVQTQTGILDIHPPERACPEPIIEPWEIPYVHYPKPKTYNRAECACTPVRNFAVLSMQRSGSGWFETFLNSHINISSNGEIFSVKLRRSNISTIVETLDRVYNLDWFSSASKNECTAAVGLKWMLNQGDLHKLVRHLEILILKYRSMDCMAVSTQYRVKLLNYGITNYDERIKLGMEANMLDFHFQSLSVRALKELSKKEVLHLQCKSQREAKSLSFPKGMG